MDFLYPAPTPPAALLRRKLQTTTTRKSKKKLLQLKMYLLWPKVLRQRRSGRGRDGKLSCTANGQRLVNCAKGSNNNSRCVCVCVCAKAIIEDALSLRSTRQKLLYMWQRERRSEGGGLLKFNERSKAVRNHKTSRWLWAWHTHTRTHTWTGRLWVSQKWLLLQQAQFMLHTLEIRFQLPA